MFIHGGWWRSLDPSMFSQMAKGPNAHGVTVAVAGYDLCPQVTIATIIEQMRAACLSLWRRARKRVFVYGHSAGGHLAACMVARTGRPCLRRAGRPGARGLRDLRRVRSGAACCRCRRTRNAARREIGARLLAAVLEGAARAARSTPWSARWNRANSCARARSIADDWRLRGVETRYEEIAGANHFTVIDPLADPEQRDDQARGGRWRSWSNALAL